MLFISMYEHANGEQIDDDDYDDYDDLYDDDDWIECSSQIYITILAIFNMAIFFIVCVFGCCCPCCGCGGDRCYNFLSGLFVFLPLAIMSAVVCLLMSLYPFKAKLSTICALIEVIWSVVGKLPFRWIARADKIKGYADKSIKMNEMVTNVMHIAS